MVEREIKLYFGSTDEARSAVVAAGALPLRPRRLQDDRLFDTADGTLRGLGCALRLRREYFCGTETNPPDRTLLTFKGPVQPGLMKIREEHETEVADGEPLIRVFQTLAMRVAFRYQKYREEFASSAVTIAIDETPVGTFVEIEGDERPILAMARALDRTPADFILDSYQRLFFKRREEYGLLGDHMVFPSR
jgi:adenylate cyclase class 2